jgi:UDPglucose 6-dehydrogenase/GDP-mannose 6-dehydrogenase
MRVSIVGAGYVGLVTAACLADQGHDVVCADVDRTKVDRITGGVSPIYEPGLDELMARNVGERLRATTDVGRAVAESDLTLVAVGTPSVNGRIDLGAVVSATRAIGSALAGKGDYHLVAVKSTVVPGTTDGVVLPLLEEVSGKRAGADFGVGVNPEFLTEGQAVKDFMSADRLVLGGIDQRTHAALEELYGAFAPSVPRLLTDTRTAEMIKYASNALLATMISFANEIGNLCTAVGDVDVVDVMRGVHLSHYLSPAGPDGVRVKAPITAFLEAGCGFGGSCFPKDVRALIGEGDRREQPMRVLRAVIETNDQQPEELLRLVERAVGDLQAKRVTVLGLAFKPDTDDVRESPAIPIVQRLVTRGARVTIHDPVVADLPGELQRPEVSLSVDLEEALREADVVVLVTRWAQYLEVPALLAALNPAVPFVDGRRLLEKESVANYFGIGAG